MTARFFWGVVDGKLICYKRTGECNQCGDCCKAGIFYQCEVGNAVEQHTEQERLTIQNSDWTKREGWAIFSAQGIWWYFKVGRNPKSVPEGSPADTEPDYAACGSLTEEMTCGNWMEEDFRPICRYWPFLPEHILWVPECGFRFEEVEL